MKLKEINLMLSQQRIIQMKAMKIIKEKIILSIIKIII